MSPLIRKIEPGDVIGRCRLIRELGRGGVGTVYLATHQTLQIEVALKVLSPSLSMDNPALAERFIREAQLAARIRHPNVIAVMDAAHDETTGLYFIVMEYVGGGSLSWHLRHGPLPEAKALAIVTGIAHALVIAEENRIVHRDIKPDNIMLDQRGTAKLADLGLAKHDIDSRISLTLGGTFMGTPAYMSPDQARDAKVADTRDDIYSLGASFFECLTGSPPFQGETPYNIMSELLTKPTPRPRTYRPELSRSVDLICRKMMAKTRDLRYPNAHALLRDLQHAQIYGDTGIEQLQAYHFDQDSINAHQQALDYGIETSADGVYAVPELPEDTEAGPISRRPSAISAPRRADYGVIRAAALLIALVTGATLFLAWTGPHHRVAFLQNEFARLSAAYNQSAQHPTAPATHPTSNPPVDHAPHMAPVENPPLDEPPVIPSDANPNTVPPGATPTLPVAQPVVAPDVTNAVPAVPVNPADLATPAQPAAPDSAFTARYIAENSLHAGDIGPTGHAELLKIIGKRDPSQITPTTWTFYFFDKNAAGHAQIVTITDGKLVKSGEDFADSLSAYSERDVLPEDKLQKDSTDVLQIAQGLMSDATVSSSEFTLSQQKNSVPMWRSTFWSKDKTGSERKLGDITVLSENGMLISRNLKP